MAVEQTSAQFSALAEAEEGDPVARGARLVVVAAHDVVEGEVDAADRVGGAEGGVLGPPAEPALEGAPFAVDGEDVGPGLGGEGGVGVDEAEVGLQLGGEAAALGAEDAGVGAAAVEAEDAGEAEGWILGVGRRRCYHDGRAMDERFRLHGWNKTLGFSSKGWGESRYGLVETLEISCGKIKEVGGSRLVEELGCCCGKVYEVGRAW